MQGTSYLSASDVGWSSISDFGPDRSATSRDRQNDIFTCKIRMNMLAQTRIHEQSFGRHAIGNSRLHSCLLWSGPALPRAHFYCTAPLRPSLCKISFGGGRVGPASNSIAYRTSQPWLLCMAAPLTEHRILESVRKLRAPGTKSPILHSSYTRIVQGPIWMTSSRN